VLSAKPPHRDQPSGSIEQRLQMLDMALADYPGMISDDIEVRRNKASYTFDTLQQYREQHPKANLILIVGSDIMKSFHKWYRADEILGLANLIVMHRAGYSNLVNPLINNYQTDDWSVVKSSTHGHVFVYPAPAVPISATKVRQAVANNEDVSQFLHPKVNEFIQQNQLYSFSNFNALMNENLNTEDSMIENYAQSEASTEPVLFDSQQQLEMIVEELEDNKALDITVLNVAEVADFTDFMVIATGTSNTHLQAICTNAIRELSRKGVKAIGEEGRESNEWVLADFGDVVVHIMRAEVRELYELEKLWNPELRKALAEDRSAS